MRIPYQVMSTQRQGVLLDRSVVRGQSYTYCVESDPKRDTYHANDCVELLSVNIPW